MALPPSSTMGDNMKYVVLMYADPADTKAMSAAERDEVGSKHRELRA
jgi:hypothetical protein